MFIPVFISITINVVIMIICYFVIKYRIEKKVINKDIIGKIKKEVNSMILQLNETTLYNINLIEDAVKNLDKKIIFADKKKFGLKIDNLDQLKKPKSVYSNQIMQNNTIFDNKKDFSYSPEKIVNQSQKNTEKLNEEAKKENIDKAMIDEKLKSMTTNDKVKYLISLDMNIDQIKKKLGLSSGELEFLMNIENIKK